MMLVVGCLVLLIFLMRVTHGGRDPSAYLVPMALAFPPLLVYGSNSLGWPGGWLSTRVALALCIVIFLVQRIVRRDFSYRPIPGLQFVTPYVVLVVASVLWAVLGSFNSDAGALANEFLSWLILAAIFFSVAGSLNGETDIRTAGRVLVAIALIEVGYSALQGFILLGRGSLVPAPIVALTEFGREDLSFGALRLYGTLPNVGPNFVGAFLLAPTLLAFSRAWSQRGIVRVGWLVSGILCAVLVAMTYSRGALLGLAIGLVMIPVWRRSWRGVVGALSAMTVAGFLVGRTPVGHHVNELYSVGQLDVSSSARLYLWRAVLKSATSHPIGLGFNGWPRDSRHDVNVGFADVPSSLGSGHPAENQWMRELADRGVLGVLALAVLLTGVTRLTFRSAVSASEGSWRRDVLIAVGAGYVGWALVFLTGDHLMYDNVAGMYWYTTALALAALRHDVRRPA